MIIHQAELTSFSPNTFGRCVSINGLEVVLLLCLGELAHVSMKKSASHPHLLVTVRPGVLQVLRLGKAHTMAEAKAEALTEAEAEAVGLMLH